MDALSFLYEALLEAKVTTPTPTSGGRVRCNDVLWELSSCVSSAGGGDDERRVLRDMLASLQMSIVARCPTEEEERAYAFSPTEVRAIVEARLFFKVRPHPSGEGVQPNSSPVSKKKNASVKRVPAFLRTTSTPLSR